MKKRSFRVSIVTRLSILIGLLVLGTAIIVYIGGNFRTASLYHSQRETRVRFLAKSLSYGIQNILVSAGSRHEVERVVKDALRRTMSADPSIIGCEVRSQDGAIVYSFISPGVDLKNIPKITVNVMSEGENIGTITLHYFHKDILEDEKTQQVVVIGNTIASMVLYYMKKSDFFQIKYLSQKIIEEDPDVLYCSITGPFGVDFYSYQLDEFKDFLNKKIDERAESVSVVQPIVVQEIGTSAQYGRMVEVAVLINEGNRRLGVVRIGYSMATLMKALARSRLILSLVIIGTTLLAFGISLILARGITRPLEELTAAARSISPHKVGRESRLDDAEREIDELSASFDKLGEKLSARGDEVGELASSFQDMIHTVADYIGQLKVFYQKISLADRLHAMGQLSAGIAHEINNPLTIISTYTQMMLKRPDIDSEMREELETIYEEIGRIADKVRNLQSFAQESRFEFVNEDIHLLLNKTLDLSRHQLSENKVSLLAEYNQEETLFAHVDSGKLRQVFLNLIFNAIHAMEKSSDKQLLVSTASNNEDGTIDISFSDTGSGIQQEHIKHIFDPFFTTKKSGAGTGLGLAICYNIVRSHGGTIAAESTPGSGTTFRVCIPVEGGSEERYNS